MTELDDALLDAMSDGAIVTDARGRIVRTNAAMVALLGAPALGRAVASLPLRAEWSGDPLLEPPTDAVDGRLQVADGTHRLVHVRFRALSGGRRLYVVEDRTELRKLRHRLSYADRLANAGALAAGWLKGFGDPEVRLQRAASLLADPWSADDATDLAQVARGLDQASGSAELVFALDGLPRIALGPSLARQVLANLVDNALRHRGRRIRIEGEHADGRVVVIVVDDGEGLAMTPETATLPYTTTRDGAQGLGLTVVRDIVEGGGGSLDLTADPHGTSVTLTFPVARTQPEPAGPPATEAGRRVLVIDDEPAVLRMIGRTLRRDGIETVGFGDGLAALEHLGRGDRFDAILCDVEMPTIDGRELARRIASDHPSLAPRIAMISGSDATLSAALDGDGPRHGLTKPFRADALRELLARLLE
ncbi:MAG: response regulator [Alphaproteobacteria bacterium]|nr:response regulator [Alphaproteobacteria bacterium]MCB9699876.1 response regulator [Alphaproteobacteria bacterium]